MSTRSTGGMRGRGPAPQLNRCEFCGELAVMHELNDDGEIVCDARPAASDPINHPPHYTSHPSGVECITVTEWFGFNVGNAIKYLWRAGEKGDPIVDLEKARWYVDREIQRLGGAT